MKNKMDKSSLIILIVVGIIVLAVVGYGIWQAAGTGKEGEETSSNASTVSDTVELNDENINGTWERTDGTSVHRLTFSENQKLAYEKFENGSNTTALTSTDGSYEISGNKVTISVTADGDTVTETCEAVLSEDTLVLTGVSEVPGFFAGKYKKTEVQEEPSSTPDSTSSEPKSEINSESSIVPESSVSDAGTPVPKPTPDPEEKAQQVSKELGSLLDISLYELFGDSIPEPVEYYHSFACYRSPQYPNLDFYYHMESGINEPAYMISAAVDYLIPGKSSYTYQELKDALGDNIGEIVYLEVDSAYAVNGFMSGYSLLFSSAAPPPDEIFETFTIRRPQ